MTAFELASLALVAVVGPCVVAVRDPKKQTFVAALFGLSLALFFLAFRAPDVALSQLVVSTAAMPTMVLLALARIRGPKT